jgi:hypothetical protein
MPVDSRTVNPLHLHRVATKFEMVLDKDPTLGGVCTKTRTESQKLCSPY